MNKNTRCCIAYVAGRLITGKRVSDVYDYSTGAYHPIDGSVGDSVDVYDYVRGCHVDGNIRSGRGDLYDYGNGAYIEFKIKNNGKFEGYDYGSGEYYEGHVHSPNSIEIYDYQTGRYYSYSL